MPTAVQFRAHEAAALEGRSLGTDLDQRRIGEIAVDEADPVNRFSGQLDIGEIVIYVGLLGQMHGTPGGRHRQQADAERYPTTEPDIREPRRSGRTISSRPRWAG